MCLAVFVSTPLSAENVSAACVGWVKYAQIRIRAPDRFFATLRAQWSFFKFLSMSAPASGSGLVSGDLTIIRAITINQQPPATNKKLTVIAIWSK